MSNQAKDFLEKQIQGLLINPDFTMTEENYQKFLVWVKGITFEAGSSEMALAYITIMVMSDDDFIVSRDRRTQDLLILVKVIIHIYNHAFEAKSTLLLLVEALDFNTNISDMDFRNTIIRGETNFERVIACVRKPVTSQPVFVQ